MWRFLKRFFAHDENRCRCASSTHGHEPGQCRNAATRADGLCASCFEHAADRFQDTH
jgi:hypothetical protein